METIGLAVLFFVCAICLPLAALAGAVAWLDRRFERGLARYLSAPRGPADELGRNR